MDVLSVFRNTGRDALTMQVHLQKRASHMHNSVCLVAVVHLQGRIPSEQRELRGAGQRSRSVEGRQMHLRVGALKACALGLLPHADLRARRRNSHSQGHVRQPVFSCLTCKESSGQPAGICATCSITCHSEHEQVELFSRRNFQCDCGTTRLGDEAICT